MAEIFIIFKYNCAVSTHVQSRSKGKLFMKCLYSFMLVLVIDIFLMINIITLICTLSEFAKLIL